MTTVNNLCTKWLPFADMNYVIRVGTVTSEGVLQIDSNKLFLRVFAVWLRLYGWPQIMLNTLATYRSYLVRHIVQNENIDRSILFLEEKSKQAPMDPRNTSRTVGALLAFRIKGKKEDKRKGQLRAGGWVTSVGFSLTAVWRRYFSPVFCESVIGGGYFTRFRPAPFQATILLICATTTS